MVPELLARQRVALGAIAVAATAVVALVAATHSTGGVMSVVVALALAPVAVVATAVIAGRIGGDRFGIAAAAVYVVLPFLANRYMLPTYRGTFDTHALPALVGLQHTGLFALGVALAVIAVFAPARAAAAVGVAGFVAAAAAWQFAGVGALRPALHETIWSITLIEWLLLSGVLGVVLRAPLRGAAVSGWLLAAAVWAAHRGYENALFWRSLSVAAPAAAIALSSLALLVPRLRASRAPAAAAAPGEH